MPLFATLGCDPAQQQMQPRPVGLVPPDVLRATHDLTSGFGHELRYESGFLEGVARPECAGARPWAEVLPGGRRCATR